MEACHRDVKFLGPRRSDRIELDIGFELLGHVGVWIYRFPRACGHAAPTIDTRLRIDEELAWQIGLALDGAVLDDCVGWTKLDASSVHAVTAESGDHEGHRSRSFLQVARRQVSAPESVPLSSTSSPRVTEKPKAPLGAGSRTTALAPTRLAIPTSPLSCKAVPR